MTAARRPPPDLSDLTLAEAMRRWRADPCSFIETCVIDPETRRPFEVLPAERDFFRLAFLRGDDGRLLYPEQVYAAPKKSGKTTLAALHVITTLFLFGGRYAEAYAVANDYEQAQGRVFEQVRRTVEASPLLKRDARISHGKVVLSTEATIVPIASDYASAAGGHPTITVFDELWAYTSERARRLWDEMVPVPTRKVSLRLTVTYAGFEGESDLLHDLYKRGVALPEVAPGVRAGDGLLLAWHHEPVAPWQTEAWLAEMRRSLRPNQYLRMIENRFVSTESTFVDMNAWDRCVDPDLRPVVADRSLSVWVGVDASVKHDSTAIVAVTFDKSEQRVRLVAHRVFQPTPDDPIDFEYEVERTLATLFKSFRVQKVLFDPYQMAASAQRLTRARIPIEEFPQTTSNLTAASQNLYELVNGCNLRVYPDAAMRLSVSRAVAVESTRGWRIAKEKQAHKIDVVVALAQAALAAVRAQSASSWDPLYRGRAWDDLREPATEEQRRKSADEYRRARLLAHIYGLQSF